jgi:Fic family protein
MVSRLRRIDYYCHADSNFSLDLLNRHGSLFVVRAQIQEALATSKLDGLQIPYGEAETLILHGRKPRNAGEVLVKNFYSTAEDIGSYVGESFSRELLWELYARVISGVDGSSLRRSPKRAGLINEAYRGAAWSRPDKPVSLICAYANDEIGSPDEHTVVRALSVRGAINHWMPLPDWNGNVASLVFRLYCLKHDLPAVAYLPFSYANLQWDRAAIRPPVVLVSRLPPPYVDDRGNEDYTPTVTLSVHLLDYLLADLMTYMKSTKEKISTALTSIENDTRLNNRQLLILSRALNDPGAEFTISHHRTNHRIVYATARKDLLDLVEMGYMVMEARGRLFVFRAASSLRPERN